MEKPTLYKKIPLKDVETRNSVSLSADEQQRVNDTINKFFELFKDKHLS
jgi:hypothetical protein